MRLKATGNTSFREYVIEKLLATPHVVREIPDDKIEEEAAKIGVHANALIEARVIYKERRTATRRGAAMGVKRAGTRHYQIKLTMPDAVYQEWLRHAEQRGVDESALLRSLLHAYLLGSYEPETVLGYWFWNGQTHRLPKGKDKNKHRARAMITLGARRALIRRAQRRNVASMALLRALVLEAFEGNFGRPGLLPLIDARSMYDDEHRYYLGEQQ